MVLAMALALLYRLMMGDLTASLAKTGGWAQCYLGTYWLLAETRVIGTDEQRNINLIYL